METQDRDMVTVRNARGSWKEPLGPQSARSLTASGVDGPHPDGSLRLRTPAR